MQSPAPQAHLLRSPRPAERGEGSGEGSFFLSNNNLHPPHPGPAGAMGRKSPMRVLQEAQECQEWRTIRQATVREPLTPVIFVHILLGGPYLKESAGPVSLVYSLQRGILMACR